MDPRWYGLEGLDIQEAGLRGDVICQSRPSLDGPVSSRVLRLGLFPPGLVLAVLACEKVLRV